MGKNPISSQHFLWVCKGLRQKSTVERLIWHSWTTTDIQNPNLHFPLTLSTIPLNFSSEEEQEACVIPKRWRHFQGVPQGIHHVIMSQVSLLCYVWLQHDGEEGVCKRAQVSEAECLLCTWVELHPSGVKGVTLYTNMSNSFLMSQFLFRGKLTPDIQIHKPWISAEIDKS